MVEKIKGMLGSLRFYLLLIVGVVILLYQFEIIPKEVAVALIAWLGGDVGMITLEKIGTRK